MKIPKTLPFLFSIFQLLLSGCVTTNETPFTSEVVIGDALEQRLSLARRYIGDRNWEDAKRNLRLATEISPINAEVYEVYALFHQSTFELDLAEEYFKKAITLHPDFSRARNNYAALLYMLRRYEEAQIQLLIVTSDALYSARPQAFVNLGMCQLKLSDLSGAEKSFKKVLLMDPNNVLALVELGHMAFGRGDITQAKKRYDARRSIGKRQSSRALWLGILLAREENDRDSYARLSLLLKNLYPDSSEYDLYERNKW